MRTRRLEPREANIEFRAAAAKSRNDCRKPQAILRVTLRHIRVGEEMFVRYGMKYWLE